MITDGINPVLYLLKKECNREVHDVPLGGEEYARKISEIIHRFEDMEKNIIGDIPVLPTKLKLQVKVYQFVNSGCEKVCVHDAVREIVPNGDHCTMSINTGGQYNQIEISVKEDRASEMI